MLDEKTRMMLEVANQLTADNIELLKAGSPMVPNTSEIGARNAESEPIPAPPSQAIQAGPVGTSRGAYERRRTRESKVSTGCLGKERAKHEWWPVGADLVGRIGNETVTATVVENTRVKSGRSILITSGLAQGKVCNTPTRAALEATEDHRQANNLGRGGGVTNGWTFWKPRSA